jgi:hypothetical protein
MPLDPGIGLDCAKPPWKSHNSLGKYWFKLMSTHHAFATSMAPIEVVKFWTPQVYTIDVPTFWDEEISVDVIIRARVGDTLTACSERGTCRYSGE